MSTEEVQCEFRGPCRATCQYSRSTAARRRRSGTGNVLPPMREALRLRATGGEVSPALRDVRGVHVPLETF
ncbi:hypothetical protein [Streptomyces sp. NBC_00328]|uniref:hypothetical protein n=1 Tax=Streptomyces sp. NBC_00328 TaxID=2903646 RepID=UPI002E27C88F|nr:hypothetical protein [Streptomyces sp. NBC_00328]